MVRIDSAALPEDELVKIQHISDILLPLVSHLGHEKWLVKTSKREAALNRGN